MPVAPVISTYIFRPPVSSEGPAGGQPPFDLYRLDRGITVLQVTNGGPFTEVRSPTDTEVTAAYAHYRGGYENVITATERTNLIAAGYGAYIQ